MRVQGSGFGPRGGDAGRPCRPRARRGRRARHRRSGAPVRRRGAPSGCLHSRGPGRRRLPGRSRRSVREGRLPRRGTWLDRWNTCRRGRARSSEGWSDGWCGCGVDRGQGALRRARRTARAGVHGRGLCAARGIGPASSGL
ncbi:hypothetical protein F8144_21600 [Streptomyces triticiradicis]|uniref:Uncharacterized protein n=1 Tax=Streptomyces triticiradicis TaxID=2651189 RepID=A0A7J5DCN0_9ACTN|nr:hypothetical protein F8144_21600 [Streptomyces triticiradicis]